MDPAKPTEETKIETPAKPINPPGAQGITASKLVSDDNEKFPPSRDVDRDEGDHAQGEDGPENEEPDELGRKEEPRRHPGGRPKGKKDSYKRGRPHRPDWADRPMKKPPAQKTEETEQEKTTGEAHRTEETRPNADYLGLATFAVDMLTGGLAGGLGEHWRPMPAPAPGMPSEREMLIQNLRKYLEENQIKEITPGWMLLITVCGYAIPRVIQTVKMKRAKKTTSARDPNAKPAVQPAPEKPAESAPAPAVDVPPVVPPDKFQSEESNRAEGVA